MAVDSKDKRASATHLPWMVIAPTPDGTIDAEDREQISGYYAGITPGSPVSGRKRTGLLIGVYP